MLDFGSQSSGGTALKREKTHPSRLLYRHAKFHAGRCHRRRDICNWTQQKMTTNIPFHTPLRSVLRVIKCDIDKMVKF